MNSLKFSYRFVSTLGLFSGIFLILFVEPAFAHPGHGSNILPNLAEKILTPQITTTGLVLAFGFGSLHALAPGHGKAIVTTYLIGSNSTPWQAFILSIITTLTHTFTIFLLGFIVLFASKYLLPEQLYFVFSLLSGLAICIIGFWRLESYLNPVDKHHEHHYAKNNDLTAKSLITLGVAGGLTPCLEASILLLGAIALNRAFYGILLVFAFSLGLTVVLTIVGLVAVYCRRWLDRLPQFDLMQTYLPLISAIAISLFGLFLTTEAMI